VTAPLANEEIAQRLDAFAVLLELAGAERYTSRAYRRAAETIRETPAPVAELARAGRAQDLRGRRNDAFGHPAQLDRKVPERHQQGRQHQQPRRRQALQQFIV